MDVTIYTNYLVVSYHIIFNGTKEQLAQALDEGSVLLPTEEGGSVLINPLNAAVIEIKEKK